MSDALEVGPLAVALVAWLDAQMDRDHLAEGVQRQVTAAADDLVVRLRSRVPLSDSCVEELRR